MLRWENICGVSLLHRSHFANPTYNAAVVGDESTFWPVVKAKVDVVGGAFRPPCSAPPTNNFPPGATRRTCLVSTRTLLI
jgi:hypothetical protein